MPETRQLEGKFFRWKVEGKVVTMQGTLRVPCQGVKQFYAQQVEELKRLALKQFEAWTAEGIEIVEFWTANPDFWEKLYAETSMELQRVRVEKDGRTFCQLSL